MDKTVVVTGASRGIGSRIADELLAQGWAVINLDRIAPLETSAEDPNVKARWIEVDLADADALSDVLAELAKDETVCGLVNNAAIGRMSLLEDTSLDDFDLSVAINMRAPTICAKALLPSMQARGFGRIVNIASRAHLGKTHRTAYAGTKGALVSMTRVWALEYAADGITCNAIAPGPIRTELFDNANPPGMPRTQAIVDAIPVGRLGLPDDIANAAGFLMHERTGFITGQVIYVCGGVTLARGGS